MYEDFHTETGSAERGAGRGAGRVSLQGCPAPHYTVRVRLGGATPPLHDLSFHHFLSLRLLLVCCPHCETIVLIVVAGGGAEPEHNHPAGQLHRGAGYGAGQHRDPGRPQASAVLHCSGLAVIHPTNPANFYSSDLLLQLL